MQIKIKHWKVSWSVCFNLFISVGDFCVCLLVIFVIFRFFSAHLFFNQSVTHTCLQLLFAWVLPHPTYLLLYLTDLLSSQPQQFILWLIGGVNNQIYHNAEIYWFGWMTNTFTMPLRFSLIQSLVPSNIRKWLLDGLFISMHNGHIQEWCGLIFFILPNVIKSIFIWSKY